MDPTSLYLPWIAAQRRAQQQAARPPHPRVVEGAMGYRYPRHGSEAPAPPPRMPPAMPPQGRNPWEQ